MADQIRVRITDRCIGFRGVRRLNQPADGFLVKDDDGARGAIARGDLAVVDEAPKKKPDAAQPAS